MKPYGRRFRFKEIEEIVCLKWFIELISGTKIKDWKVIYGFPIKLR